MTSTAHTQRRSNRQPRKRKHLTEITRSSKPSKHVLVDAASSKYRQPHSLIPTPPLTEELIPRKAADTISYSEHYNCDHIWDLIRESKAKQYPSNLCLANLCLATMDTKGDSTAISIITTPTQAKKEQHRYAEEMLHPRWIAIERTKNRIAKPLPTIQEIVQKALDEEQSPDIKSIIEDELFASISNEHRVLIKSRLKDLKESRASELQWEARLWRRWFLKDSLQDLNGDPLKPFIGRIVQAKMSLSRDRGVLPPLLASADNRRESRLFVAPVPWAPNLLKQKGNHILWYPDYLYAVSLSSLRCQIHDLDDMDVDQLPAFRLAQYKHLPANWIAEIKSENTEANHLAAEHYSAFISAYLLHERLLLHWIAKNESIKSNNPVEINDSLAVHCMTCCGSACKIWRMSVRKKETKSDLEPVRYDMQLLDTLDLENGNDDKRLCDWINALNALALTVQFKDIIADLKGVQANESRLSANESHLSPATHNYSWTSKVGFVYKAGSTQICVASLDELRKAYNNGDIKAGAGQRIGDKVIEWDDKGQPIEVDITQKGEQVSKPDASSILPSAPYAGNTRMTQVAEADLRRLTSSTIRRITQAFSAHENSEGDMGSTKEEHIGYVTRAQQALAAGGMDFSDIWKIMKLSKVDLNRLRVETLRVIYDSIGARDLGPTATKKALVKALSAT